MAITTRFHTAARLSAAWALQQAQPRHARRLGRLAALAVLGLHAAWAGPPPAVLASTTASADTAVPSTGGKGNASRQVRAAVGCLIGPERVADIGTPLAGVVGSVKVDRGDAVKKGQVLVLLDSEVEQAAILAARARSSIDAEVHAAQANVVLARDRYERMAGLVGDGFVSKLQLEQARAERDVAEQKLQQARGLVKVQAQELGVARAQLGQRTLHAPFNGVVVERFVNAGERVEDKPLLRVAMLDPLRVELVVPAARWGSLRTGERIGVLPELPGAGQVLARVTHIDKMIDAASNTFRVRLALPNPGHKLPAGARCKADLPAAGELPVTPAAPAVPPADLSRAPAAAAAGLRPASARPSKTPRLKLTV